MIQTISRCAAAADLSKIVIRLFVATRVDSAELPIAAANQQAAVARMDGKRVFPAIEHWNVLGNLHTIRVHQANVTVSAANNDSLDSSRI